jgi:ferredoxin
MKGEGMKTAIYYFTGTGNSLWVADALAKNLDCQLIPMVAAMKAELDNGYERVVLVFPTYMHRPPRLVVEFIEKLGSNAQIFVVATNGGDGGGVLNTTKKHFAKNGLKLHAGYKVLMPDNFTPFGGAMSQTKQDKIFEDAKKRIPEIAKAIESGDRHMDSGTSFFRQWVHPGIYYAIGYAAIPFTDSGYRVNDNCVGCESCRKSCPVDNITMQDDRPHWNGKCQQCYACLQWCKKEAIDYKKVTVGLKRYHHPEIKRRAIIGQKSVPR